MKTINLTIPLYEGMPVGNQWAFEPPFRKKPITTIDKNGIKIDYISLGNETGTRLMWKACYDRDFKKLANIDLSRLMNRQVAIVSIPEKAPAINISEDDIEIIKESSYWKPGMGLIIHTGWGDNEKYLTLGDEYALNTPSFDPKASKALAKLMKDRNCDLLGVDVAYIGGRGDTFMKPKWVSKPPWQRPRLPSHHARLFVRKITREMVNIDYPGAPPLHDAGFVLAALCNVGLIKSPTARITALPHFVENAPGGSVTVIAVVPDSPN